MKTPLLKILLPLLLLNALLLAILSQFPDGQLHIYYLNVGQGDSILIHTPLGKNILIDGGPGSKVLAELSKVLPFYQKKLDMIIVTHPDQDHIEGTIDVLKSYSVPKILITGINSTSPYYKEFLHQANLQKSQIDFAQSSRDYQFEENLFFDVVYPIKSIMGLTFDKANNSSIAGNLIYGQQKFLFTGDLEKEDEAKILSSGQTITTQVLKVAHHGSKTSTTPEFLTAANPKYAIIQSGKNNKFGHPHPEILDRLRKFKLQKILRNDTQGLIEIKSNGSKISFTSPPS